MIDFKNLKDLDEFYNEFFTICGIKKSLITYEIYKKGIENNKYTSQIRKKNQVGNEFY